LQLVKNKAKGMIITKLKIKVPCKKNVDGKDEGGTYTKTHVIWVIFWILS
jgi:hypothetical protein